jgi:serine phosphatase RsbU (regulator of sigma subunit)/putative methionine-R-sulfoxide reductase with GAF domain
MDEFIHLSQLILNEKTILGQAELIRAYFCRDGVYQADVWLGEVISKLPGQYNLSPFADIPQNPLMARTAATAKTWIIGKGGRLSAYQPGRQVFSAACPMVLQGILLGVIQVIRNDAQPITADEVDWVEQAANHIALPLMVNHHTVIKNWRLEQLGLIRRVSAQIAASKDLPGLCQQLVDIINAAYKYRAVCIFTITPEGALDFQASSNISEAENPRDLFGSLSEQPNPQREAAITGKEVYIPDLAHAQKAKKVCVYPGVNSRVCIPLVLDGVVHGVLDIQAEQAYAFHEMDLLVLRSLADTIALAVRGSRLNEDLVRRVAELSIVAEVTSILSSILDLDILLDQVVQIIHEKFHYPFVHLYIVQPDDGKISYKAGAGSRSDHLDHTGLEYHITDDLGIIPWAARTGETRIVNDVQADKHYRPAPVQPERTAAEIALPLKFGNSVLGILDIQSDKVNDFTAADQILLETMADAIAIAIRNAKLYYSERWRRQTAESLREVAGLLSANAELEKLLDGVLQSLEGVLPCDASAVWLIDPAQGSEMMLEPAVVHGLAPGEVEQFVVKNPGLMDWLEQSLYSPQPVVRNAKDHPDPLGYGLNFPPQYSAIAVPLRSGNQPLGLLVLAQRQAGRYGQESIALTATFASYAAAAIYNNRLYTSAQEQAWVSTVLLQVAEAMQTITSIEELMETVVRFTPMLVGIKSCAALLWEEDLEEFQLYAMSGFKNSEPEVPLTFSPADSAPLARLLAEGQPVFIDNLPQALPRLEISASGEDLLQVVAIPLATRKQVQGAMLVAYASQGVDPMTDPITSERLAIIQGIAHQAGVAIENMRLLESQQQETYISAALLQVAQTLAGANHLEDLYASIAQITPILSGSEICLIYELDAELQSFHLVEQVGLKQSEVEQGALDQPDLSEFKLLNLVASSRRPAYIDQADLPDWPTQEPQPLQVEESRGLVGSILLGFPLAVKNEVFGVLVVREAAENRKYLQKRLELLQGISHQTALAIQNDRLQGMEVSRERMEREFQIARDIQRTFLPSELPTHPGWELDVRWRTAREVGGDFYDVFPIPDGRLAILVADVTDKGMSAALYMTVTRTLLRTVCQQVTSPAEILCRVNELLLRDTPHGMFITAFLGILDRQSGVLDYSNAGHNLPICRRADGTMEKLLKSGMPLGILEELVLLGHQIHLEHGDSLIMFTDGVTESSTSTDFFGDNRLEEAIRGSAQNSALHLLQSVEDAMSDFLGSEDPADDMTILALHRKDMKLRD